MAKVIETIPTLAVDQPGHVPATHELASATWPRLSSFTRRSWGSSPDTGRRGSPSSAATRPRFTSPSSTMRAGRNERTSGIDQLCLVPNPSCPVLGLAGSRVEGIDELFAEYQRQGIIHPSGHIRDEWWGDRDFVVLDLDRNAIAFFERGTHREVSDTS